MLQIPANAVQVSPETHAKRRSVQRSVRNHEAAAPLPVNVFATVAGLEFTAWITLVQMIAPVKVCAKKPVTALATQVSVDLPVSLPSALVAIMGTVLAPVNVFVTKVTKGTHAIQPFARMTVLE